MRKIITTLVCWLALAAAFNVAYSQSCNAPASVTANLTHQPSWYNLQLQWSLPTGASTVSASTTTIFDNGGIVTGTNSQGNTVSAYTTTPTQTPYKSCKAEKYAIADKFVLAQETVLSAVEFYIYLNNTFNTANVQEVYVVIYDDDPSAGGAIVWGDRADDCLESAERANVYHVPTSTPTNTSYPVMKVRANFSDLPLAAGTYWIEIAVKNNATLDPNIKSAMNADNTTKEGNAKVYTVSSRTWAAWTSNNNKGVALAFTLYGKTVASDVMGYNVFRDNVQLNTEPVTGRRYTDLTPSGNGTYTYGVTAVYSSCESTPTTHTVEMPIWACDDPIRTFPYFEGFQSTSGTVLPSECWTQEKDANNIEWTTTSYSSGVPNCVPDGTTTGARKVYIPSKTAATATGVKTKLIMPMVDISTLECPTISFYRGQAIRNTTPVTVPYMDTLRVYYKASGSASSWTFLREYNTPTPYVSYNSPTAAEKWSAEAIALPNPSANYQIAFEHTCGLGNGVQLDNITIEAGEPLSVVGNLAGSVEGRNVTLSWTKPADVDPVSYAIYRGGSALTTTTALTYTDMNLSGGSHSYCVKAVYRAGESADVCTDVNVLTYLAPENIVSELHNPNWYNVHLNWDITIEDNEGTAATEIFNNGPVMTHPGAGFGGADVSFYDVSSPSPRAWENFQVGTYTIADDFTVTQETVLSSLEFYAHQTGSGITPTINKACVTIYDGDPSAGGRVVWGDRSTNRFESASFTNIYRTTTTLGGGMLNNQRPIMRVKVFIDNLKLAPGTYWVELSADGTMSANGPFTIPVMNANGIAKIGNAKTYEFRNNTWKDWTSGGSPTTLPFILNGWSLATDVTGYNVYRDDVKLNADVITNRSYVDIAPGQGTYTYGISAIYGTSIESDKTTHEVVMPINPCEIATVAPFSEGFEGNAIPSCWIQEKDAKGLAWSVAEKAIGVPATTPDNSNYKLRFVSGLASNKGAKTKLILPLFDISNLANPMVSFWHAQKASGTSQDTLRIYYKNSAAAEWIMLAEYSANITTWVHKSLALPDPSATYWIAFEGAIGCGSGVMLDVIEVGEICPPAENLGGYIKEQNTVVLTWDGSDNTTGYNVYRDNGLLATVTQTTYTDAGVDPGVHNYCVEALYNNSCGVSKQTCTSVTIATPGACNLPKDLTALELHEPEWYNVQMTWGLPDPMGETVILDEAKLVTDAGAGKGGADVSATTETNTTPGYANTHSSHYAIADDFTLTAPTFITDIDFFGFVTNSGTTSTFRAINVLIYDGDPSADGKIIWGNEDKSYLKSTEFTGIYRVRPSDMQNTERPIMKITATINTELLAGTYWVRYSLSAPGATPQTGAQTWGVPIAIKGQEATGNAKQQMPKDDLHPVFWWQDLKDAHSGASQGMPFIIHGSETFPVGYNLYRDDSLLTANPIKGFMHLDSVPGQGTYTYHLSTVWNNGYCESAKTEPVVVDMLEIPCATPFEEIYESFDKAKFPPLCWTTPISNSFIRQIALSGVPHTGPHTGPYMLLFNCPSYLAGTKGLVITPAFSTAKTDYVLAFWMYRDNYDASPGSGQKPDSVNIYLSATPDITGLTPLATVHRSSVLSPVVEKEGWYQYRVNLDCSAIPTSAYVIIEGVGMGGNNILIDDVAIAPQCAQPSGINLINYPYDGQFKIGLGWTAPLVGSGSYNVYRDGVKIASNATVTTYTDDSGITAGTHTYCVAAICGNYGFESDRVCMTTDCVIPTFSLTPTGGANGSISPGAVQTVSYGNNYAFTFTPAEGYKTSQVLIDGVNVPDSAKAGRYTFTNVTADHTINVTFERKVFSITANAGANGSISPAGATTVTYSSSKAYTVTPASGFKIQDVQIDGVSNADAINSGSYVFANINANHLIEATFTALPTADAALTGLINDTGNGALSPAFDANVTQYTLNLPCDASNVNIAATAQAGGTVSYLVNNTPVSMPYTATDMHTAIIVRSLASDGTTTKDYMVNVIRPFAASQVIAQLWDDVLSIINVPAHNGGYTFTGFQWYENGVAIDGETRSTLYLSKRPNAATSNYTVLLTTSDGTTVSTCALNPTVATTQDMQVFPNPVKAGNPLNVYSYLDENEQKGARIRLYNMQGVLQVDMPADYTSTIKAPEASGAYVLQIISGSGQKKTFNIVVQ